MIRTFAHPWLEEFWHTGKQKRVPSELTAQLLRKMDMLNRAHVLKDMNASPSNHLHRLKGDRQGQWAISVKTAPGGCAFVFRMEMFLILN